MLSTVSIQRPFVFPVLMKLTISSSTQYIPASPRNSTGNGNYFHRGTAYLAVVTTVSEEDQCARGHHGR